MDIFRGSRTTTHAYHSLFVSIPYLLFDTWHELAQKRYLQYMQTLLSPESAKITMSASSVLIWQCDAHNVSEKCLAYITSYHTVQRFCNNNKIKKNNRNVCCARMKIGGHPPRVYNAHNMRIHGNPTQRPLPPPPPFSSKQSLVFPSCRAFVTQSRAHPYMHNARWYAEHIPFGLPSYERV